LSQNTKTRPMDFLAYIFGTDRDYKMYENLYD